MHSGQVVSKEVTSIKDKEILASVYKCLFDTFIKSLRYVKNYVDNNPDTEKVVFEVNNSTFIKWIQRGISKDQYQDLFIKAMTLLNEIPVQYTLVYSKKPTALKYISEVDNHVKMTGLMED